MELSFTDGFSSTQFNTLSLPDFPYELPLLPGPEPANIGEDNLFLPTESNLINSTLWQTRDGILGNQLYFVVIRVKGIDACL